MKKLFDCPTYLLSVSAKGFPSEADENRGDRAGMRYRLASYAFPPYGRVGVSYLSEKTKERFHMIGKRSNRALPVASGIGMRQVRAR